MATAKAMTLKEVIEQLEVQYPTVSVNSVLRLTCIRNNVGARELAVTFNGILRGQQARERYLDAKKKERWGMT